MRSVSGFWLGLSLFFAIAGLLASWAPTDYSRPVPAAQLASFDSACAWFGPAVSATAYADSDLTLYHVTCKRQRLPVEIAR